jgi:dihydroorotase
MKIEIKNGHLFDPASGLDSTQSLFIEKKKIVAVGVAPVGFKADKLIDATGCRVLPGFIDLSCHFGKLGYEYSAMFGKEVAAAAKGGFTIVCCPPSTTPINDSEAVTRLIQDLSSLSAKTSVLPIGALTQGSKGVHLSEMFALKDIGCVAVSGNEKLQESLEVLKRSFEYASTHNITVMIHPEEALLSQGVVHEGEVASRLGLEGISELAETIAVSKLLLLAEHSEVHLHFSQLSTAKAVDMITEARNNGLRVTADVAIHNLLLTDESIQGFDANYHVIPPLRTEADRQKLIEGISNGGIDAICSHHRPLSLALKQAPFAESAPGMSSVELTFSLGLKLINEGLLQWEDLVIALTSGPASVLGIDFDGLSEGASADIVIVDESMSWEVNEAALFSNGKNTPWLNSTLDGVIRLTLSKGKLIYSQEA